MKILIIGAKGMLGQELALAFQEYKPLLLDRDNIDIADENQVKQKICDFQPDLVLNCAAYNDVDGAEGNEPLARQINGLAVGYLAQAVRASGGILVHYSTDYVFDGTGQEGYREADKPNPLSAYGRSKLLGETELQKNCDKFYLIRLSRLFGKAAQSDTAKKSFVEIMLQLSKTKKEIKVVNEELDCPTYAPDLASKTKEIVEQKMPFGIYHITNTGACAWYDFAKEIFAIKKINVKITPVPASYFPRPAKRPIYSILLNTKINSLRCWQEALKDYLKWIK